MTPPTLTDSLWSFHANDTPHSITDMHTKAHLEWHMFEYIAVGDIELLDLFDHVQGEESYGPRAVDGLERGRSCIPVNFRVNAAFTGGNARSREGERTPCDAVMRRWRMRWWLYALFRVCYPANDDEGVANGVKLPIGCEDVQRCLIVVEQVSN